MKKIICKWDQVLSEISAKVNFSDNLKLYTFASNYILSMSNLMPLYYSRFGDAIFD